ncbi:Xaa-Pro aminopeptidase [Alphaproteobacteria bacterium]|nr:Xaa-Pro aminopeptidase [Alphaproteobacteria bacterium]
MKFDVLVRCGSDALLYQKSGLQSYADSNDHGDILRILSGLEASAGAVVIAESGCALFVDGRYTVAAKKCVDRSRFEIQDLSFSNIIEWIKEHVAVGGTIAYDPKYYSHVELEKLQENLPNYTFKSVNLKNIFGVKTQKRDLNISACSTGGYSIHKLTENMDFAPLDDGNFRVSRHSEARRAVEIQKKENQLLKCKEYIEAASTSQTHLAHFWEGSEALALKLKYVTDAIARNGLDAYLICDSASACWLMDMRDFETKYTPVVQCYLLVTKSGETTIYLDEIYNFEESERFKSQAYLLADLKKYKTVGIDKSETPNYIQHKNLVHVKNPCLLPKAIKTEFEIANIRGAALSDSVALINFFHWIYANHANGVSELQATEKLLYFRQRQSDFMGDSFPSIVATDSNAAIVHYSPKESHRPIGKILLLDSGGQYKYGTTDITRTVCFSEPTKEQKVIYTLVLKGHIAVANAKLPQGATGSCLDPLARQYLWSNFLDYNHSTGHGIGYVSNVHEGPMSISRNTTIPLKPGMLLSNEPGFYREGEFGVRLENMMIVTEESYGFMGFDTISLVPFDAKFIDKSLLTADETDWLRRYHASIINGTMTRLSAEVSQWLHEIAEEFL